MTQPADHDSGPETTKPCPEWCKDAAEKMAGCGLMMEKMMACLSPGDHARAVQNPGTVTSKRGERRRDDPCS